jgi:ribonucleoside-diphosphate reductase alpha chain/ribonucleoside-diphosphate reductase subunit M1
MFYLRSRPKADAIQFTVDHAAIKKNQAMSAAMTGKSVAQEEECLSCGA